jgi:hypothetical protein
MTEIQIYLYKSDRLLLTTAGMNQTSLKYYWHTPIKKKRLNKGTMKMELKRKAKSRVCPLAIATDRYNIAITSMISEDSHTYR